MLYVIERASNMDGDPGVAEAHKTQLTLVSTYGMTLERARRYEPYKNLFETAKSVYEVNERFTVETESEAYVAEISSIEEFYQKYGDIIVGKSSYKEVPTTITIYDYYVE